MRSFFSRRRRASVVVSVSTVLGLGATLMAAPGAAEELSAVESVDAGTSNEFPADPLSGDRSLLSADHILISGASNEASGTVSYQTSDDGFTSVTSTGDGMVQRPISEGQGAVAMRTGAGRLTQTTDASFAENAVFAARVTNAREPGFVQVLTKDDVTRNTPELGAAGFAGVGHTYVLAPQGQSIALEQDPVSATPHTASFSADALGDESAHVRQWSAIGLDETSFQLVNRADGTCLSAGDGAPETRVCSYGDDDAANSAQRWHIADGNQLHTDSGTALAVTSDGAPVLVDPAASSAQAAWDLLPLTGGGSPTTPPPASSFETPTTQSGYDLAVGDVDATIGADGITHDEVVVVFFDAESRLTVAVIDYNANPAGHLVTQTVVEGASANAVLGTTVDIGDVDSDGLAEIVVTFQNGDGVLRAGMLEYRATEQGRQLRTVAADVSLGIAPHPWYTATDESATYADSGLADFDGDGVLELAVTAVNQQERPAVWYTKLRSDGDTFTTEDPIEYLLDQDNGTTGVVDMSPGWTTSWNGVVGSFIPRSEGADRWNELLDRSGGEQFAVLYPVTRRETTSTVQLQVVVPVLLSDGTVDRFTELTAAHGVDDMLEMYESGPPAVLVGGGFARGGGGEGVNDSLAVYRVDYLGSVYLSLSDIDANRDRQLMFSNVQLQGYWEDESYGGDGMMFGNNPVGIVAFDRSGDGVLLGEPTVFTVEDLVSVGMIGGQPPGHADWLDGSFVNVSRHEGFSAQLGSSDTTSFGSSLTSSMNETYAIGGEMAVGAEALIGPKIASLTLSGAATTAIEFKSATLEKHLSEQTYQHTATLDQKTLDDDIVNAVVQDFRVYRYPVYDPDTWGTVDPGAGCEEACYAFWDVLVPGEPYAVSGGGKAMGFFAPPWQNGNALSYPQLTDGKVDLPDLGSYTYTDENGSTVTVTEPLSNQNFLIGGVEATQRLNVSNSSNTSDTEQSTKTWNDTFGVTAGAKGHLKVPGALTLDPTLDLAVELHWDQAMTDTTTANVSASHGDAFELHVPAVNGSNGYGFGAAYYFGQDGSPRVSYGVDVTASNQSRQWWETHYGQLADPALNLPYAVDLITNSRGFRGVPVWTSLPSRQEIRGFEVRRPDGDDPLTSGTVYGSTPLDGDPVVFDVPVHNYSLVDMTAPLTVDFYAVPVDPANLTVQGEPVSIGSSQVDRIDAQTSHVVSSPEWQADANGAGQTWRIFTVLDEDDTIDEIHELVGTADEVCPVEDVLGGAPLVDPMTGEPETLACGQNNRGYGVVSVQPAPEAAASASAKSLPGPRAGVTLTGAGVLTREGDALHLDASSRIPSVVAGESTMVLVRADSEHSSTDHQMVIVYDGDPSEGNVVATTTMRGVRSDGASVAAFRYLPEAEGLHELHVVMLGTANAGGDQAQVIRLRASAADDGGGGGDGGGDGGSGDEGSGEQGGSGQDAGNASADEGDLAVTGAELWPLIVLVVAAAAAIAAGIGLRRHRSRRE